MFPANDKREPRHAVIGIALCVVLNMVDGYDILVMAFGAPSIADQWNLSAGAVGLLFSAGVVGMGAGGITLATLADRFGRRRAILLCLCLTTCGMLLTASAHAPWTLAIFRFVTGVGVGGMMPSINTAVAEYSSGRGRNLAIVIQAAGYPLGGTLGGLFALQLLEPYGWRSLFVVGGVISACLIPLAIRFIPESAEYLSDRRSAPQMTARLGSRARALFEPEFVRATVAICAVTFLVQFSFYFIVNWAPALLGRSGATQSLGLSGTVWLNTGGIVGDLIFGVLCLKLRPRVLGASAMFGCFVSVLLFSLVSNDAAGALLLAFTIGGCLFASMASIYTIAPEIFPPLVRATGTGMALSVGRVGAALGPWAGVMLAGGSVGSDLRTTVVLVLPLLMAASILGVTSRGRLGAEVG